MRRAILLLVALMAVFPAAAQNDESRITLESTSCYMTCPAFTITIHEDGRVEYHGPRKHIYSPIEQVNIGAEGFEQLLHGIEDAGYFDLEDQYVDYDASDAASVITSVTRDGITKEIVHYLGDFDVPLELQFVEHWIERVARVPIWEGKLPPIPITGHLGYPIIILDHSTCDVGCPAYMIVIYGDGTIGYLGLENAALVGIRFAYIRAEDVTALAASIASLGFFDMADDYLAPDSGDFATVMTMVWDLGHQKSVTHNLGDTTAPDALAQIEALIEQAVDLSAWIGESKNQ